MCCLNGISLLQVFTHFFFLFHFWIWEREVVLRIMEELTYVYIWKWRYIDEKIKGCFYICERWGEDKVMKTMEYEVYWCNYGLWWYVGSLIFFNEKWWENDVVYIEKKWFSCGSDVVVTWWKGYVREQRQEKKSLLPKNNYTFIPFLSFLLKLRGTNREWSWGVSSFTQCQVLIYIPRT